MAADPDQGCRESRRSNGGWVKIGFVVFVLIVAVVLHRRPKPRDPGPELRETIVAETVQVQLGEDVRALRPEFLGYNAPLTRIGSWREPELCRSAASLRPGTIRYPGGTTGNFWDWEAGWFEMSAAKLFPHDWGAITRNPYRLADLALGCRETGAQPMYVLNMLTSNLDRQLEMLRAAHAEGLPVRFVELGNEFYMDRELYGRRYPTAAEYVNEALEWRRAIAQAFPGVEVAIVGALLRPGDSPRRHGWNRAAGRALHAGLTNEAPPVVTLHLYTGTGLKVRMAAWCVAHGLPPGAAKKPSKGMRGSKTAQLVQREVMRTPEGVRAFLAAPFRSYRNLDKTIRGLLRGTKIWITEYNLHDRIGPVRNTWMHGLQAATMTLLALDRAQVERVCFHSLLDRGAFGALWPADILGRNKDERYVPTATGFSLGLVAHALRGKTVARRLVLRPDPGNVQGAGYPAVSGWHFGGDDETSAACVLNLGGEPVELDFSRIFRETASFTQRWGIPWALPGPTNRVATPMTLNPLLLRPYSITVIHES